MKDEPPLHLSENTSGGSGGWPPDGSAPKATKPPSLSAFEGVWTCNRTVHDGDTQTARFTGTATFRRSGPNVLTLDEAGHLTLTGGQPFHATRRYLWRDGDTGIEVSFADNRPFHAISRGTLRPTAIHLCPPDRYEVAYDFSAWPVWSATWDVEGPRKGYRMVSRYARA